MILLLIRHGRTDWLGERLAGRLPGISLNAEGCADAEALAAGLASARLDAVYASPLERARETAEPIAARHHLNVTLTESLQEVDFGEWTGKTFTELKTLEDWRLLHRHPDRGIFPGGETLPQAQNRAVEWVERLVAQNPSARIATVSHSDTIRLVLAQYLCMAWDAFPSLVIDPGSVSVLRFGKGRVRVLGMNWPASAIGSALDREDAAQK
jgi:probable phosphomutase (TIGR03848 family)